MIHKKTPFLSKAELSAFMRKKQEAKDHPTVKEMDDGKNEKLGKFGIKDPLEEIREE